MIELTSDGFFMVRGSRHNGYVTYSPDDCCWHAVLVCDDGRCDVKSSDSLDTSLTILAEWCGLIDDGPCFRVTTPDGSGFSRPGKVPAEEVLANLDFVLVRQIEVCVAIEASCHALSSHVRGMLAMKLGSLWRRLGDVDLVERSENLSHWRASVMLPVDGFIHREGIDEAARVALEMTGLEIIPGAEPWFYDFHDADSAQVISLAMC